MNNLNSILVEGNLVRDPELSYTPKGTAMCKFSVASNRFYTQEGELQKEVAYFDVSIWERLAQDRWTDPEGKAKDGEGGRGLSAERSRLHL